MTQKASFKVGHLVIASAMYWACDLLLVPRSEAPRFLAMCCSVGRQAEPISLKPASRSTQILYLSSHKIQYHQLAVYSVRRVRLAALYR